MLLYAENVKRYVVEEEEKEKNYRSSNHGIELFVSRQPAAVVLLKQKAKHHHLYKAEMGGEERGGETRKEQEDRTRMDIILKFTGGAVAIIYMQSFRAVASLFLFQFPRFFSCIPSPCQHCVYSFLPRIAFFPLAYHKDSIRIILRDHQFFIYHICLIEFYSPFFF